MDYAYHHYTRLLTLSANDLTWITDNAKTLRVQIDPFKRVVFEPLYSERGFDCGEPIIAYWIYMYFESDSIDMSLEPGLTLFIDPAKKAVTVHELDAPGLSLSAYGASGKPTKHKDHLDSLLSEWLQYLIAQETVLQRVAEPATASLSSCSP